MAVAYRGRTEPARHWRDKERERDASPERTKVWTEPRPKTAAAAAAKKVPVVYYLTKNGHLEHPHFMEVTLSSGDGLYLRDVINRLNVLRGKGMPSLYSWSSKRSYKNGFVWHDLTEDDFIYPAHGQEYVLKGSELLLLHQNSSSSPRSQDTTISAASTSSSEKEILHKAMDDSDFALVRRKKTQWCSLDLGEYKVYKSDSNVTALKAADAATQTDDRKQWRRARKPENANDLEIENDNKKVNSSTELGEDDISPPPSASSPETLETLIKAHGGRKIVRTETPDDPDPTVGICPSGRARASAVLINLISCGSISLKENHGLAFVPNYRPRLTRGGGGGSADLAMAAVRKEAEMSRSFRFPPAGLDEKEYFSGSLIETKKNASDGCNEFASLKRSSSYNADGCSKLDLAEKEVEAVRAKCMPRKPKSSFIMKEIGAVISRSAHGSKRITDEVRQPN